jgi:hypothetical protein
MIENHNIQNQLPTDIKPIVAKIVDECIRKYIKKYNDITIDIDNIIDEYKKKISVSAIDIELIVHTVIERISIYKFDHLVLNMPDIYLEILNKYKTIEDKHQVILKLFQLNANTITIQGRYFHNMTFNMNSKPNSITHIKELEYDQLITQQIDSIANYTKNIFNIIEIIVSMYKLYIESPILQDIIIDTEISNELIYFVRKIINNHHEKPEISEDTLQTIFKKKNNFHGLILILQTINTNRSKFINIEISNLDLSKIHKISLDIREILEKHIIIYKDLVSLLESISSNDDLKTQEIIKSIYLKQYGVNITKKEPIKEIRNTILKFLNLGEPGTNDQIMRNLNMYKLNIKNIPFIQMELAEIMTKLSSCLSEIEPYMKFKKIADNHISSYSIINSINLEDKLKNLYCKYEKHIRSIGINNKSIIHTIMSYLEITYRHLGEEFYNSLVESIYTGEKQLRKIPLPKIEQITNL